jgi:hypothetical protein
MSNSAAPATSAALGLDRALRRQRFQVTALVQHRLQQARDRTFLLGPFAQRGHRLEEATHGLDRTAVQARHLLDRLDHLPDRPAGGVGVGGDAALGRVADPAPG